MFKQTPMREKRKLNLKRLPCLFCALFFTALSFLFTGCGLIPSVSTGASGSGRAQDSRMIQVVIEDNPQIRVDSSVLSASAGSDLSFLITPAPHCTVLGTDYRDYSIDYSTEASGSGQYLCTLHDVRYSTVVSVLTEENPYTIRYEANGGDILTPNAAAASSDHSVEFSYPSKHLRVNTEQGTGLFSREGYTLTGWNTAADGSGGHIGLGSRVSVQRNEPLTLYAEWARWNDAEDFLYVKNRNSVTITGYRGTPEVGGTPEVDGTPEVKDTPEVDWHPQQQDTPEVAIPSEIEGLPVTEIAEGAFAGLRCRRVILPPTIKSVAVHSFDGCTLSELILFDATPEVSDYAFEGCPNLQTIRINACVPPVYSGSYYDTFPDKYDRIAELRDRAKIVLFSGSSTRFGYDSAYLDDAFPAYDIVDMGVFAYTNALPQLDLIRQNMRSGDILLHSPEFDAAKRQFCTTNAFDDKFFNMIEADYDLLAQLDYRDYSGVLSAYSTYQKTRRGMQPGSYAVSAAELDEDGNPVSSPSYNEYGDYIVYRPNSTDDAPIYDLPLAYTVGAFPQATYIDPLNAVYDKFAADGIRVLFTYAPRNKAALSEESDNAALAELDAWFRDVLHAEVISDLQDSLYPGRYLYGTDNHLSTEGVAVRTERIRRDLEEVLSDAK